MSETPFAETPRQRVTRNVVELDPRLDIRERFERFNSGQVADAVRGAILDARQRQAGEL